MINPRPPYSNELYHYGVKGMKWGIRRYQPYPSDYHGNGRYIGGHARVSGIKELAKKGSNKLDTFLYDNARLKYLRDGYSDKEAKSLAKEMAKKN